MDLPMEPVETLAGLLATYGVYALLAVFLWRQHITKGSYTKATKPEEKAYFRKLHTWNTVAVYVLTVVVVGVWTYATFFSPEIYLKGTVKGLEERAQEPAALEDPPSIRQQLVPYETDVELFTRVMRKDLTTDHYDLGWILVADRHTESLGLVFQQLVDHPSWPSRPRVLEGVFVLDLKSLAGSSGKHIHLQYQQNRKDPYGKLGHLLMKVGGETLVLREWQPTSGEMAHAEHTAGSFFSLTRPAFAQSEVPLRPDVPVGRIATGLASPDLKTQLQARRLLEQTSSLDAVQEILDAAGDLEQQPLLLHNLSIAVNRLYSLKDLSDPQIDRALADALYETGDYAAALPHFERLRGTKQDVKGVVLRRGNALFRTRRYEESATEYQRYLAMSPSAKNRSVALGNLGAVQVYTGQWAAAEESYKEALSLDPSNLVALSNYGFFHYRQEDFDSASALYHQVLDRDPEWVPALAGLAAIEESRGALDEATALLESVVRKSPNHATSLNNLAFYYAEQGKNLDRALEYVDRAIALRGERAEYLDTKGWVLYKKGEYPEALSLVRRSLALSPKDDERRYHLLAITKALQANVPTAEEAAEGDHPTDSE